MRRSVAARLNSTTVLLGRALRGAGPIGSLAAEHRSALGAVYYLGPIRMGALAAAERLGAPAMTRTIGILERRGLVRREADPADERAVLIRATRKGAAMVKEGRDERVRRIDRALAQLSPSARRRIATAVGDLEQLLGLLEGADPGLTARDGARRRIERSRAGSQRTTR